MSMEVCAHVKVALATNKEPSEFLVDVNPMKAPVWVVFVEWICWVQCLRLGQAQTEWQRHIRVYREYTLLAPS